MESWLSELNPAQQEAVAATEGYVRVIAGAGSGKTRALTARFAYLVLEMGILPSNVLCVTFTNKAAGEMRRRIHNLLGDSDTGLITTFHGLCVSILQEEIYAVGYPESFLVLDNTDIDGMLRIIYEERGLTLRDMSFADARDMFEIRKMISEPDYYLSLLELSTEQLREKYESAAEVRDILFYGYLYQEKKCFALDYNDLISVTLYIFGHRPEIARKWQQKLEYIMIDEFQDIDPPQYRLMEVLAAYHKNLFVVGDPDQTIYTWRGADIRFLTEFDRHFPGTRTVMMNENYRSGPEILAAVNSLIEKNRNRIRKDLTAFRPAGSCVKASVSETPEEEAAAIADEMERLLAAGAVRKDLTVLYRAHYLSRGLEAELQKRQIPYRIYGAAGFFDRAEVKDALSYLRMVALEDDLSFRRIVNVPRRNIGEKRMRFLEERAAEEGITLYAAMKRSREHELFAATEANGFIALIEDFQRKAAEKSISSLLTELLAVSGYEKMLRTEGSQERLNNLAELKQLVLQYEMDCGEECTLRDFLAHIALYTDRDRDTDSDEVKLMTVHAAKGLEFPYVFLCGLNEGAMPSRRAETPEAMEEERRLCFVAMSRARDGLWLSAVEGRLHDGSPRYLSRFLLDVDPGLITYVQPPRAELIEDSRAYVSLADREMLVKAQGPALRVGDRVRHAVLGCGIITASDEQKKAYYVSFDTLQTPRAISWRAKLEKTEE